MPSQKKKDEGSQFVRYFGPVLNALRALGGSGTPEEVTERIAQDLGVSDETQNELTKSGQPRFRNQVAWARFYLVNEGLLDRSRRGVWALTERGRDTVLTPEQSREIFLRWVKINQERRKAKERVSDQSVAPASPDVPEDEETYRDEVLNILLNLPADGFERLSQRLLREAGFTEVKVTGSTGDGGIDGYGTLQINPLVSFKVLFQCKKYAKSVSPSHVRDFRGAMAGRADKGIIMAINGLTHMLFSPNIKT